MATENGSPAAKRLKLDHNHSADSDKSLLDIQQDLQQAAEYLAALKQQANILTPNQKANAVNTPANISSIASEITSLKNKLREMVEYMRIQQNATEHNNVVQTMICATKEQLYKSLPLKSFAYLASTCSNLLKFLSPLIDKTPVHLPNGATEIKFKVYQPKILLGVETPNLPPYVTQATFRHCFNQPIRGLANTNLTHLTFGASFNQPVNYLLPLTLTHLTFGELFNTSVNSLPPAITHLTFGENFDRPVNYLPATITHLKFGGNFSQPLENIPPNLQLLVLGVAFDHSIDALPDSIHTLSTHTMQPINKLPASLSDFEHFSLVNNLCCPLPASLKDMLSTGGNQNGDIDFSGTSLTTLKILITDDLFTPNLDNLPHSLTELYINGNFNDMLPSLPPNLTFLSINSDNFDNPLDKLPDSLVRLIIGEKTRFTFEINAVPTTLKHLEVLAENFDEELELQRHQIAHLKLGPNFNQPADTLPQKLTHVIFQGNFNQPLDHLPPTLTHILFAKNRTVFDKPLINLPPSITHLSLSESFNQPVDSLPPNVYVLKFGKRFNQNVDHLPPKINVIFFGYDFNQPTDNLPLTLRHLTYGHRFNRPVDKLPPSVTAIDFGHYFDQPVDHLPPNLRQLAFGYAFNHTIDHLPSTLIELNLGVSFNRFMVYLPPAIRTLTMCLFFNGERRRLFHRVDFPTSLEEIIYIMPNDFLPGCTTLKTFEDSMEEDAKENFALCCYLNLWQHKTEFVWLTAKNFYERFIEM